MKAATAKVKVALRALVPLVARGQDYVTCTNVLPQLMRRQRGEWLGARCHTLVPLDTAPLRCPYCRARVL